MTNKDFIILAIASAVLTLYSTADMYHDNRVRMRLEALEENIQTCNCSISYGGQNMSVEDAFERAGEGLTVDQADEVKILIEEYCDGQ